MPIQNTSYDNNVYAYGNSCKGVRIYHKYGDSSIDTYKNLYNTKVSAMDGASSNSKNGLGRTLCSFRVYSVKWFNCNIQFYANETSGPDGTKLKYRNDYTGQDTNKRWRNMGMCDEIGGDGRWCFARNMDCKKHCRQWFSIQVIDPSKNWFCMFYENSFPLDAWIPVSDYKMDLNLGTNKNNYTYGLDWTNAVRQIESNCGCKVELFDDTAYHAEGITYKFASGCSGNNDIAASILGYSKLQNLDRGDNIKSIRVVLDPQFYCTLSYNKNKSTCVKYFSELGGYDKLSEMKDICKPLTIFGMPSYTNLMSDQCKEYAIESHTFKSHYDDEIKKMCEDDSPILKGNESIKELCGCYPMHFNEDFKTKLSKYKTIFKDAIPPGPECADSCRAAGAYKYRELPTCELPPQCLLDMSVHGEEGTNMSTEDLSQSCNITTNGGTTNRNNNSNNNTTNNDSNATTNELSGDNKTIMIIMLIVFALMCLMGMMAYVVM
jgi:hypothetical protein